MRPEYFRIAATKTEDAEAIQQLRELEALATDFVQAEDSFAERIHAIKAKRGEPPVKLRKPQREQLAALDEDRRALDVQTAKDFEQLDSAQAIVWALHYALSNDLSRAAGYLKFYHPDERPLGEEMIALKKAMHERMQHFLDRYPAQESEAG
ncbi:hypothetical protein [Dokdonella sp.]|uniref:hypothetical protein n=1 Tax=Dokdonella sp. TaxID=2291710 RepID=UPI001B112CFD|nr:hypothetical protein [Dokdonella sp.]MBO9662042.1 hypothetical protein [Dokdonella sp.]